MRDEIPFGLDEDSSNTLAALRISLASLEAEPRGYIDAGTTDDGVSILTENKLLKTDIALYTAPPAPANSEPVAWLWSHRKHPSEVSLVRPEDDERAEGAHWSGWSCQALYAAPPASAAMKDHQIRELVNELRDIAVEYHGTQQLRERIARTIRAAMLQGAENVKSRCTIQTAPALDSSPKIAESPSGNSPVIPECSCRTCRPVTISDMRFVVCPECGNKRCPHANDHRNACTGSNEPGQEGSAYPAALQQEVKP
nr:hypothetical protein [Enterobacter roggenkampii]